jgi:hypothetical protein
MLRRRNTRSRTVWISTEIDPFSTYSGKSLAARFRTLAERYPDVRHLVLPRANVGSGSVFASVIGDVLLRFKRLVTVDASRLYVSAEENKATAAASEQAKRPKGRSSPTGEASLRGTAATSSEDGRSDAVADILRRCLDPAEFALLRFSPLDLAAACGCAPGD